MPIRAAAMTDVGIDVRSRFTRIVSTAQNRVATGSSSRPRPSAMPSWRQDQGLADEQHDEGDERREAEPLAEERDRQQGDPHEQRLLDEGRARRAGLGEPGEEEDERDAPADHADEHDADPAAPIERPDLARRAEPDRRAEQDERRDGVLERRVDRGVGQLLDREGVEVDRQAADERGADREGDPPADADRDGETCAAQLVGSGRVDIEDSFGGIGCGCGDGDERGEPGRCRCRFDASATRRSISAASAGSSRSTIVPAATITQSPTAMSGRSRVEARRRATVGHDDRSGLVDAR